MLFFRTQRKLKWWNNGWTGLVALTILFVVLFTVGKLSPEYEPDPIIEGRNLSEWTDDLDLYVEHREAHHKAVKILKNHKDETKPVLLQWLEKTDSIPRKVYLTTMLILRDENVRFRGARFSQAAAADALREIGDSDQEICDALRRVVDQHGGELKHIAVNAASRALSELSD